MAPGPAHFSLEPISRRTDDALRLASTATLATVLFKRGLRNQVIAGVRALRPSLKMVGIARTLRYLPNREDLDTLENWQTMDNPQRAIIEGIEAGQVIVIDARQSLASGTMGGMLVARAMVRGAAGIVSDGPFRDHPFLETLAFASYAPGANANTNLVAHHPEDMDVPIACGGVQVRPGDVLVGDAEGVIVIPRAWADDVAQEAAAQEHREAFIEKKILEGGRIQDWYPMTAAMTEEYLRARANDEDAS